LDSAPERVAGGVLEVVADVIGIIARDGAEELCVHLIIAVE
jgi:hypothetical protein